MRCLVATQHMWLHVQSLVAGTPLTQYRGCKPEDEDPDAVGASLHCTADHRLTQENIVPGSHGARDSCRLCQGGTVPGEDVACVVKSWCKGIMSSVQGWPGNDGDPDVWLRSPLLHVLCARDQATNMVMHFANQDCASRCGWGCPVRQARTCTQPVMRQSL